MINRLKNYDMSSNDDEPDELTEKALQEIEELLADTEELKKVAAKNVLRACDILDMNPTDEVVAGMLLQEAVVMMQVVHRVESFFKDESGK
jgi:hypothetical protein